MPCGSSSPGRREKQGHGEGAASEVGGEPGEPEVLGAQGRRVSKEEGVTCGVRC